MDNNTRINQRSNISLEKSRASSANVTAEPTYTEYRAGQSNYRSASQFNNSQPVQPQYQHNQNNYQSNQSQYPQNLNNYQSNQPVYQQYQNNSQSNQSQYQPNRTNAQSNQSYYQQNQNNTQPNRSYYQQYQNNAQSNQSYYQQNRNNAQSNQSYYQQYQNNAQSNQSYYQQNQNNTSSTSSRSGQYTPPDYIPDTDTNINNHQLEFSSSSFLNRFTRSGSESPAMGYFLGIVGALIGAIPGAILIILLGTLGYAACVSGAVLFLGVFYLYRMLSGSVNNFDKIDWTIVIGVCVIGVFLSVKASFALKISMILGTSFGETFSNLSEIMTLVEIKGKFIISLIITYLFAFVGATKTLGASLK